MFFVKIYPINLDFTQKIIIKKPNHIFLINTLSISRHSQTFAMTGLSLSLKTTLYNIYHVNNSIFNCYRSINGFLSFSPFDMMDLSGVQGGAK